MSNERGRKPASPSQSFLGLAVLILLGLLTTAGIKSYHELAAAQHHEKDLKARIADTEGRIRALSQRIEQIENDPFDLERAAREQLGMVRPDDVVIILPDDEDEDEASQEDPAGPPDSSP